MSEPFLSREIPRDPNYSVPYALYLVLRRQPWKALAGKAWSTVQRLFLLTLIVLSTAAILAPAKAHAGAYEVYTADVPFTFQIGEHVFRPGQYQFIFAGNGVVAIRDAHARTIASVITRSIPTGSSAPANKLIFATRNKHTRLAAIRRAAQSQAMEVLGEQLPMPASPAQPASSPLGFYIFTDKPNTSRFKE